MITLKRDILKQIITVNTLCKQGEFAALRDPSNPEHGRVGAYFDFWGDEKGISDWDAFSIELKDNLYILPTQAHQLAYIREVLHSFSTDLWNREGNIFSDDNYDRLIRESEYVYVIDEEHGAKITDNNALKYMSWRSDGLAAIFRVCYQFSIDFERVCSEWGITVDEIDKLKHVYNISTPRLEDKSVGKISQSATLLILHELGALNILLENLNQNKSGLARFFEMSFGYNEDSVRSAATYLPNGIEVKGNHKIRTKPVLAEVIEALELIDKKQMKNLIQKLKEELTKDDK
ncbi:MAG: hypothetical protein EOP56_15150 [Sphingobacteriales bacterium]|nr:MAG: hypothetical protein EOP56_15150 [Sphingobacteriales bacterium]